MVIVDRQARLMQKCFNIKIKFAFTLAEVLITLGIIGVVASITIPTLMKNTQDAEFKSKWKKEYSVMAQAVAQMVQDNGGSIAGLFTSNDVMRDNFKQYLKYSDECANGASFGNCWASVYNGLNGLSGSSAVGWGNTSGLILNDGASIMFESNAGVWSNCLGVITAQLSVCGYVPVDVNGPQKGPNVVGRDIFSLWVLQDKILPEGCIQDGRQAIASTECSSTGSGSSCSAKYLYN